MRQEFPLQCSTAVVGRWADDSPQRSSDSLLDSPGPVRLRVPGPNEKTMDRTDALTALALVFGLVLVALLEQTLRVAGLTTIAAVVYPVGYGALVLVGWYVWIRPLDLRSPTTTGDVWEAKSARESNDEGNDTH